MVGQCEEPNSRWYTGSGIYREVHLLTGPAVHIEPTWPRVTTGGDVVTVRTKVTNTTDADTIVEVAGVVTGPQGDEHPLAAQTADIPRCGEAIVDHELRIDGAQHWSPAHPHLHEARVVVGSADTGHGEADKTDEATARFGIRDLSVTVDGLSIDGEDHILREACIHHDNGMLGAATFRDAETRRVRILKEAGFNAIRSAHNPASRRCSTAVEAGLRWNKTLADKVRALDPTRPVTNCINGLLNLAADADEDKVQAKAAKTRESGKQASNRGVILLMNMVMGAMSRLMTWIVPKPIIDRKTRDAYAQLDVAGYNHTGVRMVADHELHPGRVMVCSEETPKMFMQTWRDTQDAP